MFNGSSRLRLELHCNKSPLRISLIAVFADDHQVFPFDSPHLKLRDKKYKLDAVDIISITLYNYTSFKLAPKSI